MASMRALVGEVVEAGALLVSLDCRDHRLAVAGENAALASLRAQLTLAQQQLKRARELRRERNASAELVDQRQTERNSLEAQLRAQHAAVDAAKLQVERCTISAPYHALVLEHLAGVGEISRPGMPLLRVLDVENIEVSAQIPSRYVGTLDGAGALQFRDADGRSHPLDLRILTAAVDSEQRSREARLRFRDHAPWTADIRDLLVEVMEKHPGARPLLTEKDARRWGPLWDMEGPQPCYLRYDIAFEDREALGAWLRGRLPEL